MEVDNVICLCPIEGIIDLIAKKWSLLIINELGNHGSLRFNELMRELRPITPKMLSDLLKELTKEGLVKRKTYNTIPPKVEYSLTEKGKELRKAIIPLIQWAFNYEGAVLAHCSCSLIEKGKPVNIKFQT
jgi:DNA-binding HxlR family transcriptional regulator